MAVTASDEENVKHLRFSQVCEIERTMPIMTLETWPDRPARDHSKVNCSTQTLRADAIVLAHCELKKGTVIKYKAGEVN